jgi:hypothetical protein
MFLTAQQQRQLAQGEPVELDFGGQHCVLMTRQAFDRVTSSEYDASPWTVEEMNLLAAEAVELVSGDGLDQEDDK